MFVKYRNILCVYCTLALHPIPEAFPWMVEGGNLLLDENRSLKVKLEEKVEVKETEKIKCLSKVKNYLR